MKTKAEIAEYRRLLRLRWSPEQRLRENETKREWRRKYPERWSALIRKWRQRNPQQAKAHRTLSHAVWKRKIIKPDKCSLCGQMAKVQGHHEDYSKPLDVLWICFDCHLAKHGKRASVKIVENNC